MVTNSFLTPAAGKNSPTSISGEMNCRLGGGKELNFIDRTLLVMIIYSCDDKATQK